MTTLVLLEYTNIYDQTTTCGIFSSEEKARLAIPVVQAAFGDFETLREGYAAYRRGQGAQLLMLKLRVSEISKLKVRTSQEASDLSSFSQKINNFDQGISDFEKWARDQVDRPRTEDFSTRPFVLDKVLTC